MLHNFPSVYLSRRCQQRQWKSPQMLSDTISKLHGTYSLAFNLTPSITTYARAQNSWLMSFCAEGLVAPRGASAWMQYLVSGIEIRLVVDYCWLQCAAPDTRLEEGPLFVHGERVEGDSIGRGIQVSTHGKLVTLDGTVERHGPQQLTVVSILIL